MYGRTVSAGDTAVEIALHNADCITGMASIPDGSADMILTDLPYGMTDCKWDIIIPTGLLWEQYNRIVKLKFAAMNLKKFAKWNWMDTNPYNFIAKISFEVSNRTQNHSLDYAWLGLSDALKEGTLAFFFIWQRARFCGNL